MANNTRGTIQFSDETFEAFNDFRIGESMGIHEFSKLVFDHDTKNDVEEWLQEFDPTESFKTSFGEKWHGTVFEEGFITGQDKSKRTLSAAIEAGEMNLWIEWQTPKTLEQWEKFDTRNPDVDDSRWITEPEEDSQ